MAVLVGKPAVKKWLRRLRIVYLDHVENDILFDQIVAMDLEGIVCKRKDNAGGPIRKQDPKNQIPDFHLVLQSPYLATLLMNLFRICVVVSPT